jgi:enoyl-CoA hydratase
MEQLVSTLQELDRDDAVRCIVLGGNDKAFAAGADIAELARSSAIDLYYQRRIERWDAIRGLWTPLVAAVSGYCLGGGCELALACDLIVASKSAKFGQPETGVGVLPGAGGTQRLTRAVGKALAMDVILSGRFLRREALAAGLVAGSSRGLWLTRRRRSRTRSRPRRRCDPTRERGVDRAYEGPLQSGSGGALYLAFASDDAKGGPDRFHGQAQTRFQRGRQCLTWTNCSRVRDAISVKRVRRPDRDRRRDHHPGREGRRRRRRWRRQRDNGGGAFGIGAKPVGAYVIKDGDVSWQPAVDVNRIIAFTFVLGLVFAFRR